MPKIVLGKRPKSFKRTVKFPMHDGTEGTVEMSYIYRTRTEFGEFIDAIVQEANDKAKAATAATAAAAEAAVAPAADAVQQLAGDAALPTPEEAERAVNAAAADAVKFALSDVMRKTVDANADYILKIADGWNLDVPFNRENVLALADELPAGANAVMDDYRAAIQDGRLGN